jgi:hypothetical protein
LGRGNDSAPLLIDSLAPGECGRPQKAIVNDEDKDPIMTNIGNIREARSSNRFSIREVASVISRAAHVIERIGLAMAGALCGLLVAALLLRANIDPFDSVGLTSAMMLFGLIGFYLGIDTPPPPSRASRFDILDARLGPKVELIEIFVAAGTFVATTAALASVYVVVFDEDLPAIWTVIVGCWWLFGGVMQIVAGIAARTLPHRR